MAVVVPAHNEARFIVRTLQGVPHYVDHVIVVDDASTDGTAPAAAERGDRRLVLLRHDQNRGVGAAITTGYRTALRLRADVVVVMAGDAQMDPADLPRLVAPVISGQADYVKGDRLSYPAARAHMPLPRWVANHVLTLLTCWATGLCVRDSQCGYTALSLRALRAGAVLPLDRLWPRYGYPNDLLGWLASAGLRIRDVVVRPVYGEERSGVRLRDALVTVPFVILRLAMRRLARALRVGSRPVPDIPALVE